MYLILKNIFTIYLLLNLIILSKNTYFLNLYIIFLLNRASHGRNTSYIIKVHNTSYIIKVYNTFNT